MRLLESRMARRAYAVGLPLLVLIVGATLYAPAINHDYVWDDQTLFVDSPDLREGVFDWSRISTPIFTGSTYVRPFAIATFIAEFKWLGLSSSISHAINLSIFLLNTLLVMWMVRLHCDRLKIANAHLRAAIAGLLYSLHPCLIESTAWVSGRFDLLATNFVLSALVADLVIRNALSRALIVSAFFGLALGSKEVAVVLPILLVVQRLAVEPSDLNLPSRIVHLFRAHFLTAIVGAAVFATCVTLRLASTSQLVSPSDTAEALGTVAARVIFVFETLGFYVKQVFAPFWGRSMPLHPATPLSTGSAGSLLRASIGASALLVIAWCVKSRKYSGWMLASALTALTPVINIVVLPSAGNIGADRFLTLPLAFVAAAAAMAPIPFYGVRLRLTQVGIGAVLCTWVLASVANTSVTLPLWKDNVALWTWLYNDEKTSPAATQNFIAASLRVGQYDQAKAAFAKLLAEGPLEAEQQISYGMMLANTGDPEEGLNYIKGAMSIYPRVPYAPADWRQSRGRDAFLRDRLGYGYYALAEVHLEAGRADEALKSAAEALRYRPAFLDAQVIRTTILEWQGQRSAADFQLALHRAHPSEKKRLTDKRLRILQKLEAISKSATVKGAVYSFCGIGQKTFCQSDLSTQSDV